ncbi:MAG: phage holin family protein [Luteolibacter sp.]
MTHEDGTTPRAANAAAGSADSSASASENWPSALGALVSARIAIISEEARIAAESTVKKVALAVVAAITGLLFWVILMAGLIGFVPSLTSGLAWFHVALIIAGIHLLVAIIAILLLKKKSPPSFSLTRSEFEKDRQWLSKSKQNPTSGS